MSTEMVKGKDGGGGGHDMMETCQSNEHMSNNERQHDNTHTQLRRKTV